MPSAVFSVAIASSLSCRKISSRQHGKADACTAVLNSSIDGVMTQSNSPAHTPEKGKTPLALGESARYSRRYEKG
jgi:hypothetical protein